MTIQGWTLILLYVAVIVALAKPIGVWLFAIYEGRRTPLHRLLGPVERGFYRLAGIDPDAEQGWRRYTVHMLLFQLVTLLFTYAVAIPIGIYSAVRQYSVGDYVVTCIGFIGLAVPNFLLALVIMYLAFAYFGASVGGLFSTEYMDAPWSWGRVQDLLKHLWIPAIILSTAGTAQLVRILRANLLDELRKPYVVTARAKGLSELRAILKYPVRVALNPFISTVGYTLPFLVSGSIIVSIVLSLPTVGPLLLKALLAQDMFLAGTMVLLLGIMTVIGTLISDILLVWIDPRIRLEDT